MFNISGLIYYATAFSLTKLQRVSKLKRNKQTPKPAIYIVADVTSSFEIFLGILTKVTVVLYRYLGRIYFNTLINPSSVFAQHLSLPEILSLLPPGWEFTVRSVKRQKKRKRKESLTEIQVSGCRVPIWHLPPLFLRLTEQSRVKLQQSLCTEHGMYTGGRVWHMHVMHGNMICPLLSFMYDQIIVTIQTYTK